MLIRGMRRRSRAFDVVKGRIECTNSIQIATGLADVESTVAPQGCRVAREIMASSRFRKTLLPLFDAVATPAGAEAMPPRTGASPRGNKPPIKPVQSPLSALKRQRASGGASAAKGAAEQHQEGRRTSGRLQVSGEAGVGCILI